jgi:very-short-patch-repair endonuclease
MKKLTTIEFIKRAINVHGNRYDYSNVNYINTRTAINIVCIEHGIFKQVPSNHLAGQNCPICMKRGKSNNERFIIASKQIHGDKYDYSNVKYINNRTKIDIICKEHGLFKQLPIGHLNGNGCPLCGYKSFGEEAIAQWFNQNKINFTRQKSFLDCKNKLPLLYDFWIEDINLLIEYDGIQHYKIRQFFGGRNGFNVTQINDKIKTEYALNNKINLLRIRYTEKENISEILKNNIIFNN